MLKMIITLVYLRESESVKAGMVSLKIEMNTAVISQHSFVNLTLGDHHLLYEALLKTCM